MKGTSESADTTKNHHKQVQKFKGKELRKANERLRKWTKKSYKIERLGQNEFT